MFYLNDEEVSLQVDEHQRQLKNMGYDYVLLALQGSQNYGVSDIFSDVDTKTILLPNFEDVVFNRQPVNTTKVLQNEEHIVLKDARMMFNEFRKQNMNFVELLFSNEIRINEEYYDLACLLIDNNEKIAHYCPCRTISTMNGMVHSKFYDMEKQCPSQEEVLQEYGYAPKQLHHLLRIEEFMKRYIDGEPYADCMKTQQADYLISVKRGLYSLEEARTIATSHLDNIEKLSKDFLTTHKTVVDEEVDELLNNILLALFKRKMKKELL